MQREPRPKVTRFQQQLAHGPQPRTFLGMLFFSRPQGLPVAKIQTGPWAIVYACGVPVAQTRGYSRESGVNNTWVLNEACPDCTAPARYEVGGDQDDEGEGESR